MGDCAGLIGLHETELTSRLGEPVTRRTVGSDAWLIFNSPDMQLRVRCAPNGDGLTLRVASWAATFETGFDTLAEAARSVGLWPVAAPDESADCVTMPLIRRPLPCPARGTVYSLSATVRYGRFTRVSVFDEEPDWL
jgi:hypothetical protein